MKQPSDFLPRVFTLGYGNRGFESFITVLQSLGVTDLVDVRSIPQSSYWKEFAREALAFSVPASGIRYIYMGDTLGAIQSPEFTPIVFQPEVEAMLNRENFESEHPLLRHPNLWKGIDALAKALTAKDRVVCLFCGCMRPETCHRSSLLGEALRLKGIETLHVSAKGEILSQREVEKLYAVEQLSLF